MIGRAGVALLEVLVAMTIFTIGALTSVEHIAQLESTEAQSDAHERTLADADRLMTAYSLLDREDLDRRLGRRAVGVWLVDVERPRPNLYRIEIGNSGRTPDLAVLVYRPEAAHAN